MQDYLSKVLEAVAYINEKINEKPEIGVILGSGLGALADEVSDRVEIPYDEIPNFPSSAVEGHEDKLIIGKIYGKKVVFMQGRFHYYEGFEMDEVVFPIRVFAFLGVTKLIVSNAAGGINPSLKEGDLVLITDHINISGLSPLRGGESTSFGVRFPNMKGAYSQRLISIAKEQMKVMKEERATDKERNRRMLGVSKKSDNVSEGSLPDDFKEDSYEADIDLKEGIYAFMPGPQYETAAEIKMLSTLGADCVGMSTVPEVIAATQSGIEVLGISCITNICNSSELPSHEEVLQTADRVSSGFKRLVMKVVNAI